MNEKPNYKTNANPTYLTRIGRGMNLVNPMRTLKEINRIMAMYKSPLYDKSPVELAYARRK